MDIAIDFDGTCVTHEFPKTGKEIGAAPVLRELVQNGHRLILNTMRSDNPLNPSEDFLSKAIHWFDIHNIPLWASQRNPTQNWTSSPKCYAELYIDDAALGAPLIYPTIGRPYYDWERGRTLLVQLGIIM